MNNDIKKYCESVIEAFAKTNNSETGLVYNRFYIKVSDIDVSVLAYPGMDLQDYPGNIDDIEDELVTQLYLDFETSHVEFNTLDKLTVIESMIVAVQVALESSGSDFQYEDIDSVVSALLAS